MKVTIVLHEDHHADPAVYVFAEAKTAIEFADKRLTECDRFKDARRELTPSMQKAGWMFYGSYGEDNSIRVEMKEVQS